jgi:agmatinase
MDRIKKQLADHPRARLLLAGFPWDVNSSFLRGPARGPAALRRALYSPHTSLWAENGRNLGEAGLLLDLGDVPLPENNEALDLIEEAAETVFQAEGRPIFLGGDHTVTYPILKAAARRHSGLTLVVFDSHPDLYDVFEGNRFSHACPFARIMEDGLAARLIQIGVREIDDHQREQVRRFGAETIEMKDAGRFPTPAIEGPVYLSFDLDALDPAFAPGVSHHEPGGLSTRAALEIIHNLGGDIIGADVVELNPDRDLVEMTAAAGAKLVKEIGARMLD